METAKPSVRRQALSEKAVPYALYVIAGLALVALPAFIPPYLRDIVAKALILGIFAMSLNLLGGYTGLTSMGHAAYFGLAGYTAGILIVRLGVTSFWLVAPAGIVMATVVAAAFGVVALRVSGVYFLAITFALGELLSNVALKWRTMTGGSNGLVGIGQPDFGLPVLTANPSSYYFLVLFLFAIVVYLMHRLVNSSFGYALQGIRDNEPRMRALGYHTWLFKYIAFIIAGLVAGIGGALFAFYSGVLVPQNLGILTSATVLTMTIVGGQRVFIGPVIGAMLITFVEYFASTYAPTAWPVILGCIFVLSVMFLRGGVTAYLVRLWRRVR